MTRHRLRTPSRRPDRVTVLAALTCALLLAAIIAAVATADTPITACYTNPDIRGTWC